MHGLFAMTVTSMTVWQYMAMHTRFWCEKKSMAAGQQQIHQRVLGGHDV